ncbi:MAG: hypothetical protein IT355_20200 [Gemmatimonadaceae bacterium]|nr:hypothetical protein [Gemmatimonadaceae bacterium]
MRTLSTTAVATSPVGHSSAAVPGGRLAWPNGVTVSLASAPDGDEIAISDTGRFTLQPDGETIIHHAPPGCDAAAVALDIIGVVLPFLLHREGAWCVHASAVLTASGVIAFVAPRGTGKSTLAAACLQAGCALVADDVVVLRNAADGVHVTPAGVPLRLHERTARQVAGGTGAPDEWGKVRIPGALATDDAPLAAVYVLSAAAPDAAVARVPRPTRAAALALLANGKITELLGATAAGEALSRCVALAHAAPVFDLAVPRDLARLGDVTATLRHWHAGHGLPGPPVT